jgi:hypothetical protein
MITYVKTPEGGPYQISNVNGTFIPVSLRGPCLNSTWLGHSEEMVINALKFQYNTILVQQFKNWQEGLAWCMNEPYLLTNKTNVMVDPNVAAAEEPLEDEQLAGTEESSEEEELDEVDPEQGDDE